LSPCTLRPSPSALCTRSPGAPLEQSTWLWLCAGEGMAGCCAPHGLFPCRALQDQVSGAGVLPHDQVRHGCPVCVHCPCSLPLTFGLQGIVRDGVACHVLELKVPLPDLERHVRLHLYSGVCCGLSASPSRRRYWLSLRHEAYLASHSPAQRFGLGAISALDCKYTDLSLSDEAQRLAKAAGGRRQHVGWWWGRGAGRGCVWKSGVPCLLVCSAQTTPGHLVPCFFESDGWSGACV